MLTAEAASMLKLRNGDDDGAVMDGSLLEEVVVGFGLVPMDGNSPVVGMYDDDDEVDVRRRHLAGPLFWVQTLESNTLTPPLSDPLDMSTAQKNFISHYYSTGVVVASLAVVVNARAAKAMSDRRRRRRTTTGSRSWAAARDRVRCQRQK